MYTIENCPNPELETFVQYLLKHKVKLKRTLRITFTPEKSRRCLAGYWDKCNTVTMYCMRDSFQTLAHEIRHADQYENSILPWKDGKRLESDADKYADIWVWDYFFDKANNQLNL